MKKNKHIDFTNILLTVLLIVTVIANGVQNYFFQGRERFEWNIGVISSKENVVQVSSCNFKGNSSDINKNMILDNSWDKINNSENNTVGAFFPDSLSISWFSYNEKKFYTGNFVLPYETILKKAVQMGIFPTENSTYRNDQILCFVAEIQPKGRVAVWIQKFDENDNETKIKIGTYQTKEIKATWHIFDHYSETDKTSDIDISKKVALVMERHSYRLEIKLPDGYTLDNSYFEFFNQNIYSFSERKSKTIPVFDYLPKEFYLKWGNGKKKFMTQFSFDEEDILDNFRKESGNAKAESLVLELIVNDRNNGIKVILKNTKTNSEFIFKDRYKSKNEMTIFPQM